MLTDVVVSGNQIYVAGAFSSFNWTDIHRVVRLNSNGSVDTSFADPFPDGSPYGAPNDNIMLALQSDGKILVAGSFMSGNGTTKKYVVRLNTDGSLDT